MVSKSLEIAHHRFYSTLLCSKMEESTPLLHPNNIKLTLKNAKPYYIYPLYGLYQISNAISINTQPNVIVSIICRTKFNTDLSYRDPKCEANEIQEASSSTIAIYGLMAGIIAVAILPHISSLSDKRGRKFALYHFFICSILQVSTILITLKYWNYVGLNMLWITAFLEGFSCTEVLLANCTNSYIADCTEPEERAKYVSFQTGIAMIGSVIGPYIGSIILEASGNLLAPFVLSLFAQFLALAWLFIIPESMSKERMLKHQIDSETKEPRRPWYRYLLGILNLFRPAGEIWKIAKSNSPTISRNILLLTFIEITYIMLMNIRVNIQPLYFQKKFHWSAVELGKMQSVLSGFKVALLMVVIPAMVKYLQKLLKERHVNGIDKSGLYLIRIGLVTEIIGSLCFAAARNSFQNYASGVIESFGTVSRPTLSAAFLNIIPEEYLGDFLGAKGSFLVLCVISANTLGSFFYSLTVSILPGLFLIVVAIGYGFVLVSTLFIRTGC